MATYSERVVGRSLVFKARFVSKETHTEGSGDDATTVPDLTVPLLVEGKLRPEKANDLRTAFRVSSCKSQLSLSLVIPIRESEGIIQDAREYFKSHGKTLAEFDHPKPVVLHWVKATECGNYWCGLALCCSGEETFSDASCGSRCAELAMCGLGVLTLGIVCCCFELEKKVDLADFESFKASPELLTNRIGKGKARGAVPVMMGGSSSGSVLLSSATVLSVLPKSERIVP